MNVDPAKIALILNGVDTDRFQPGAAEQALVDRHKLPGKFVLLTVGRLVPRKGIDHALKALPQVTANGCRTCTTWSSAAARTARNWKT